ncbi:MAG: putative Ig domain-containing protein [Treponema sp.]|nr:putative Ig domain-containing protein [Treponema sp.]
MQNTIKLFGIIALVAVMGFTMTACSDDDDGGKPSGGGTAPTITTTTLTGGTADTAYSQTLTATGDAPITWSLDGGTTLPVGLDLAGTTGVISGTPTTQGMSTFTVKATNAAGNATKALSITIAPAPVAPAITTEALANGDVQTPYSQTLVATGTAPTWSLDGGTTLPAGLSLAGTTGVISGTPTTAGTSTFTVKASNAAGSDTKELSITIAAARWTAVANSTFYDPLYPNLYPSIRSLAYGKNMWVAVGSDAKMATSTDGATWTGATNSIFSAAPAGGTYNGYNTIRKVVFGNNMWIAVGEEGRMATSTNGTTWTKVIGSGFDSTIFSGIYCLAYDGSGRWVAGGYGGKMSTSTNGTSWTSVGNSTFGDSNITSVAYGNGKWIAVGANDGKMATSTNGTTWTAVNSKVGDSIITGIAYENGWFAFGNDFKMATSTNGTTWTAVADSTFGTFGISGVAYGDDRWIAVGGGGKMATSTDLTTWTAVGNNGTFPTTLGISGVAYGNGRWVVFGGDRMAYSDGLD